MLAAPACPPCLPDINEVHLRIKDHSCVIYICPAVMEQDAWQVCSVCTTNVRWRHRHTHMHIYCVYCIVYNDLQSHPIYIKSCIAGSLSFACLTYLLRLELLDVMLRASCWCFRRGGAFQPIGRPLRHAAKRRLSRLLPRPRRGYLSSTMAGTSCTKTGTRRTDRRPGS